MKKKKWEQCGSILFSRRGFGVFCLRCRGHEGDHRGDRRQWDEKGKKPITISQRELEAEMNR